MKRILSHKIFIATLFFCLGFFTNHLLTKIVQRPTAEVTNENFPIDPSDFDMNSIASGMGELKRVEDDKNVYYHIPLKSADGANHKLNVDIKDGMIKINEDIKASGSANVETSSERMFSIDPELDANKAEVQNEKDEIIIKIPKK